MSEPTAHGRGQHTPRCEQLRWDSVTCVMSDEISLMVFLEFYKQLRREKRRERWLRWRVEGRVEVRLGEDLTFVCQHCSTTRKEINHCKKKVRWSCRWRWIGRLFSTFPLPDEDVMIVGLFFFFLYLVRGESSLVRAANRFRQWFFFEPPQADELFSSNNKLGTLYFFLCVRRIFQFNCNASAWLAWLTPRSRLPLEVEKSSTIHRKSLNLAFNATHPKCLRGTAKLI